MMATQPSACLRNENSHIHKGRGVGDAKNCDAKKGLPRQNRIALADLSSKSVAPATKTLPSKMIPETTRKDKTACRDSGIAKKPPTKSCGILSDEDVRKCEEWAKEGVDGVHFTGNDQKKLNEDALQECVKKEVEMVMSSMQSWMQMSYGFGSTTASDAIEDEPITQLELDAEVTLPKSRITSYQGYEEIDALIEAEHLRFPLFDDIGFQLKLRESDDDIACFV